MKEEKKLVKRGRPKSQNGESTILGVTLPTVLARAVNLRAEREFQTGQTVIRAILARDLRAEIEEIARENEG